MSLVYWNIISISMKSLLKLRYKMNKIHLFSTFFFVRIKWASNFKEANLLYFLSNDNSVGQLSPAKMRYLTRTKVRFWLTILEIPVPNQLALFRGFGEATQCAKSSRQSKATCTLLWEASGKQEGTVLHMPLGHTHPAS